MAKKRKPVKQRSERFYTLLGIFGGIVAITVIMIVISLIRGGS